MQFLSVNDNKLIPKSKNRHSFDLSSMHHHLPPNTGPAGTVAVSNGPGSGPNGNKNLSHVPCKFHRQGNCQAGNSCPFSHSLDGSLAADKLPCKYFQKGNCKFGLKCALAHFLPDGTRVNNKSAARFRRSKSHTSEKPKSAPNPDYDQNLSSSINPFSLDYMQDHPDSELPLLLKVFGSPLNTTFFLNSPLATSPEENLSSSLQKSSLRGNSFLGLLYLHTTSEGLQNDSALIDDDNDDYNDDDSALYEDYVPASLGYLILTPQECERRNSRSQSGTLLVRPSVKDDRKSGVFVMD